MMDNYLINLQKQIKANHKRKSFWQIWIPLAASILIVLVLAVFVVIMTNQDASGDYAVKWSSISIIYMSLPSILAAIIFLALLVGIIYLLAKLYTILPEYSHKLRLILKKISEFIRMVCDKTTSPIIAVNSKFAGFSTLFRKKTKDT